MFFYYLCNAEKAYITVETITMLNTESNLGKAIFPVYARWWLYRAGDFLQQRYIRRIRKSKKRITIVFYAMNVSMWKYQELYELLASDSRFDVHIVLSVTKAYSHAQQIEDLQGLRDYFRSRSVPFIDWQLENQAPPFDVRTELDPDILFYPQPYEYVLYPEHDFLRFYDRLLAYVPYGFYITTDKLIYNKRFHNIAWKLYYPNEYNLQAARQISDIKARNVVVSGYVCTERFLSAPKQHVWKDYLPSARKLIWAPHFSIHASDSPFSLSNFLWMADPMLALARKHADRLQIAFKPHPRLKTELYAHPDWGRQRTDDYYAAWSSMDNTQLETGDFADLFAESDAMVHDCGSFLCDYLFFRKPVMFVSKHIERAKSFVNDFGKMAYDMHYVGKTTADIERFIELQVLHGDDPLKKQRDQFFADHLLPSGHNTVAENIYFDILRSLGLPNP